ncbi:hypothetical protein DFH06DRAFT_1408057 [Mycena polygramma]|nr:hypothetical protein DFH06DRAFT_1408057 [Mycena polygramma]
MKVETHLGSGSDGSLKSGMRKSMAEMAEAMPKLDRREGTIKLELPKTYIKPWFIVGCDYFFVNNCENGNARKRERHIACGWKKDQSNIYIEEAVKDCFTFEGPYDDSKEATGWKFQPKLNPDGNELDLRIQNQGPARGMPESRKVSDDKPNRTGDQHAYIRRGKINRNEIGTHYLKESNRVSIKNESRGERDKGRSQGQGKKQSKSGSQQDRI